MGACENPSRPDVTPDVVVVLGPWSSGTSAVASAVAALGLNAHPPFVASFDHNRAERLETPSWLVPRLRIWAGPGHSVAKMPLLAWFIPELLEAWDCRFLLVHRPLGAIEATRLRRGWPALYGRVGAERIYALVTKGLPSEAPQLDVDYDALIADPAEMGKRIAGFLDLPEAPEKMCRALRRG